MSVAHGVTLLPDSPYAMWVRDELADWLRLPEGARVEVIGGDFVVSPSPLYGHYAILRDIADAFTIARHLDPRFPWLEVQHQDADMAAIGDGYIPDLMIVDSARDQELREADSHFVQPGDFALVVEVTSKSTAVNDRAPGLPGTPRTRGLSETKWSGYARCGVPFYLLVDRDPRLAMAILYFDPDPGRGTYESAIGWDFGTAIALPEPFDIEIPTAEWKPWS